MPRYLFLFIVPLLAGGASAQSTSTSAFLSRMTTETPLLLVEGEQWFSAEEGLTWAITLAAYIKTHPSAVTEPQGCIADLTEYADVFEKAKDIGAKWHLSLDI